MSDSTTQMSDLTTRMLSPPQRPQTRGGWEEAKNLKRARNAGKGKEPSLFFLSLVFTNRSLCGEERLGCRILAIPMLDVYNSDVGWHLQDSRR